MTIDITALCVAARDPKWQNRGPVSELLVRLADALEAQQVALRRAEAINWEDQQTKKLADTDTHTIRLPEILVSEPVRSTPTKAKRKKKIATPRKKAK